MAMLKEATQLTYPEDELKYEDGVISKGIIGNDWKFAIKGCN